MASVGGAGGRRAVDHGAFQVQAQDVGSAQFPQHTATQNLSIRVGSALLFAVSTLPAATQGTTYNQTISVSGGIGTIVQAIVNGNPPKGVTFNGVTGTLSGITTASGAFSFTVQATDSASPPQIALQGYTINVSPAQQVPANVTFVTQPGNSVGGQLLAGSPIVVQVTDNTGAVIAGVNICEPVDYKPEHSDRYCIRCEGFAECTARHLRINRPAVVAQAPPAAASLETT